MRTHHAGMVIGQRRAATVGTIKPDVRLVDQQCALLRFEVCPVDIYAATILHG
jgi:hypothetical protein